MRLVTELHSAQVERWPVTGRHILAQFDDETVVVYQAYRPAIGHWVAEHGYFGGPDWSLDRMSWIKPNFLWMMYRCGWAAKDGQEVVLAVWLRRTAFDEIVRAAVPSSYDRETYEDRAAWQRDVVRSDVRLQWDPDHGPKGNALASPGSAGARSVAEGRRGESIERRAIQLGLRGEVLRSFARDWLVHVEDVSAFVREQKAVLDRDAAALVTPREDVYPYSFATKASSAR